MSNKIESKQYGRFAFLIVSHFRALKHSLKEVIKKPLSCLITATVIAITLSLPAILFVLLHNFQVVTEHWNNKPTVSIYLKKEAGTDQINAMINKLRAQSEIENVKYISPAEGLNDLKKFSEFKDVVPILQNNPLPGVINLTLSQNDHGTESLKTLLSSLQASLIVDQTQLDTQLILRMDFILTIAKRIILTLATLLGIGVILVVSNTIRLITQSHRHEMQILKFIGATNKYIRRPFLYHGLLYGCIGGLLAWVLVDLICAWVSPPLLQLVQTYDATFQVHSSNISTGASLLAVAIGLSLIGSWLAIKQYVSDQTV